MSGYANSGLTEAAYLDREALEKAAMILNERWGGDIVADFLLGSLNNWIARVDWEDEK